MPTPLKRLGRLGRRLVHHVMRDDTIGLSAELSYRFFLAVFPFAIFLTSLGGLVASQLDIENPAEQAIEQLDGVLPEDASDLVVAELRTVVEEQQRGLLSFAAIGALFFATGGTNALIKALNRAFSVGETRPFWRRYLLALGLTILAGAGVVGAFVVFIGGAFVGSDLAGEMGLQNEAWTAMSVLRWPAAVVLLAIAVTILYRLAPNIRIPFRWVVPGAALFTVGWLVATWVFGQYVTNFAEYGATYGALAGVAIILIWFYMSSFLLLLGGALNESLMRIGDRRTLEALRQPKQQDTYESAADGLPPKAVRRRVRV
jgi:membrane protein